MSKLTKNEAGFGIVEIIIVLVIVGLVLAVGVFIDKEYKPKTTSTNPSNAQCPPPLIPEYSSTPGDNNYTCIQRGHVIYDKPVIYVYPTHTEKVTVKLSLPVGFSATAPAYNPATGWQVLAQPNGMLTNLADGKEYPYLFWESKPAPNFFDMTDGFVVAGGQTKQFLQKQLTSMGLDQSETSAFITYWVPKMENNPYNLIHFAGSDYTDYAKLGISPAPDSLLRVFMVFEPLQTKVQVTPQSFPPFHRHGFTVIEWGGTEYK